MIRCLIPLLVLIVASLAPAAPPNIILFIVDDLGWQDASVPFHTEPTPLNARYRTPNLERLAARGMKFTDAYAAAPVCTPSRTAILSGMSPARSHITYWTLHKDTDTSRARDDIAAPDWRMNGLSADDVTLPKLLQTAGYRTIHVGKAHFGAHETSGADPTNLGFDVNIAGHASGGPASYYGLHHFTVAGRQGKEPGSEPSVWDIPGLEAYHGRDIYLTEALTIEAEGAIRNAVDNGVPFYMNFAPYAVHAPIMANKRLLDHYPDLDEREAAYATMVETVDNALGDLLDLLDELGIADDTVVIYTSDNGGLSAHARGAAPDGQTRHTHNAPLRSGKGSAYEGGTRVPMVVDWPGVTAPASLSHEPVIGTDLFPTILDIAGVPVPDGYVSSVDGSDLVPLLRGEPTHGAPRVLGWNQPHQWGADGPGIWPFTSIRVGDLKLIYFHAGRRFELYDLNDDIGETHDLAPEHPYAVAALAGVMTDWIEDSGAQLSIDIATGHEIESPHEAAKALLASLELPDTMRPVSSEEDRAAAAGWGSGTWMDQHDAIRAAARDLNPRVVLIGDSITQSWGGEGRRVGAPGGAARERWLEPLGPVLNAGISGDRTQHVQWRLAHGMLAGEQPEWVVLMIGTNNLPHDPPAAIAAGIEACIEMIVAQCPQTRVLLVGPPPRGESAKDPLRVAGDALAAMLADFAETRGVTYLDARAVFVAEDGSTRDALMAGDRIHLTPAGYDALGAAIAERLR